MERKKALLALQDWLTERSRELANSDVVSCSSDGACSSLNCCEVCKIVNPLMVAVEIALGQTKRKIEEVSQ